MKKLPEFDYTGALDFITEEEIESVKDEVLDAHKKRSEGTGAGNDFIGWLDLPYAGKTEELKRVKKCAAKIRKDSEYLIVIGIGGSYLGARAAIDMLSGTFYREKNDGVKVLFAGNSLSPSYLADLIDLVEGHDVSLNVISKSGTTLEPAVSFRILRGLMEKKYGAEAA
jgi:glucose-6-phosphate isomerase